MQLAAVMYDGLLTYPKLEGPAGNQVVPDLAEAMPEPRDGGRTWVFTLREGIRFSDGAPVTVEDVAASLRRIFKVGTPTAGSFYGTIVGRMLACAMARTARCKAAWKPTPPPAASPLT